MPSRSATSVAAFALLLSAATASRSQTVTVKVDATVHHQKILGWSVNPWQPWITPWQRDRLLDEAVNELGLTRIRYGPQNGSRHGQRMWEPENDDGDPDHINWAAFGTEEVDRYVERWIKPFKERVEANGEKFELWISPSFFNGGSTGRVPEWFLRSPGEYAEYATAFLLHLKNRHGVEADHYVICNEPSNNNLFQPRVVGRMIRTLGPRLKALGLKTRIQFPDGVSAMASWRFIQSLKDDKEVWPHVTMLSYHLYGRNDERTKIRDFAQARGIPTGQTEYMNKNTQILYDDLALGGASYWSIYGWGKVLNVEHDGSTFRREGQYWNLRQVMDYVRPGAVRIEATSDEPTLRSLAFAHKGKTTVVLFNNLKGSADQDVTIVGLPPGRYGVCRTQGWRPYRELGVQTVAGDGTLTVPITKGSVQTIYPHPGPNLPPTVTGFEARPTFLAAPAASVVLAASATDPERDPVTFQWQVKSQPPGAKVTLAKPDADTAPATGLSVPGDYIFTVAVSDPAHKVTRDVKVIVLAKNQPPEILDLHNRIPITVTLPESRTLLRAWPNDLEKDRLTSDWKMMKQPAGAEVKLGLPERAKKGSTARVASGMTVAGDYVFRFEVTDGHNTVHKDHTVTVHPENRAPSVVRVAAAPRTLTLPETEATLTAETADPDGDTITHWWWTKRMPKGVKPSFTDPGRASTRVTGLVVPGDYVFTVTVVDRTKATERDVKLTVLDRNGDTAR